MFIDLHTTKKKDLKFFWKSAMKELQKFSIFKAEKLSSPYAFVNHNVSCFQIY